MRQRAAALTVASVGVALLMSACGSGGGDTIVTAAGAPSVPPGIEVLEEYPSAVPVPPHMQEPLGRAQLFVRRQGGTLGDPYLDPSSGKLVLTAVDEEGLKIARAAVKSGEIPAAPTEYRLVRRSHQQLQDIADNVWRLVRTGELPNGEAVWGMGLQADKNRVAIDASSITGPMLQRLVDEHGPGVFVVVQQPKVDVPLLTPTD